MMINLTSEGLDHILELFLLDWIVISSLSILWVVYLICLDLISHNILAMLKSNYKGILL
jgi:hypothetical protein